MSTMKTLTANEIKNNNQVLNLIIEDVKGAYIFGQDEDAELESSNILDRKIMTGNWIYSVDPETMSYVKTIWKESMPNNYSLRKTFDAIRLNNKDFKKCMSI